MKNKHLLYIILFFNSIIIAKAQSICVNSPSVSVNFTGFCAGKSELLTATPTNGGLTPFYTWKLNNVIQPIFTNKTTETGLSDNNIHEVYAIGSNIYAATNLGLSISANSGSTFSNKTKAANGLGNDLVNGLFVSSTKIYAATAGGLSISDNNGATFSNKTTANGLGSNIVNDVFVDAAGNNIYAATLSGLSISINAGVSFTNNAIGSVRGVFVEGTNIYAATATGLSISTDAGANFISKTTANGLGNNNVNDVYKVGNVLYVATSGGLSISTDNGNTFSNKTTVNGLGNNNVSSVFAIGGFVYASTVGGLSLSNDNGNTFFVNKNTTDGLGTNTINYAFSLGNNIYAATTGGLAIATINVLQVNDAKANDVYSVTMLPSTEGCPSASAAVSIYPLPIPNITTNSPVCTAMPLTLNSSNVRSNTGNTYSWTGPNAYSSTSQNLSFSETTVALSGGYSVTITDVNGCTATTSTPVIVNPLPIPTIGSNTPICTGFTLNLTSLNTRNINGNFYSWTGPNTYTSSNQNPSITNANTSMSGTYSVTITDVNGCTATAITNAIVNPLPTPSVSNNSPICTGFTLNLNATNTRSETGNSYAWTGPNAYTSSNQNPSITNTNTSMSGTYSVTITDANGCTATATTSVTVNPLPTPGVANNSPICTGFTLNLTATNTRSETGNSFAWTGPNAYTSTNQNPSITNANTSMSGTYSVTITDANGCTATATTSVTVNPLPTPGVANNSPICTGFTLNLTATNTRSETGNSFAWTGPNVYTSTNQNPSITNANTSMSGTYSVTITDANGCTATATTNAIVNPLPTPSVANNSPICTGFTLNLNATNTRSETGNSYAWTGPNAYTSANQNPSFANATTTLSSIYSVTITDVNGCTATATTNAIVNPLPTPSVANNSPICTGFTLNLTATNTRSETGNSYAWTGPNAYTSANQNPSFINATTSLSGVYSVTITDVNGCTATATTSVIIKPKPPVPVISMPSQAVVCFPSTLALTASGCAGAVTWSDNSTGSTITLSAIGTYSLSATCTVDGCVSEASLLITGLEIKVAPTAQASNGGPYIVGQTINLNASNGPNYSWTGPNNFTSLVSSPTIPNASLQNSGIYSVTVSINGCTATATTNVIVNDFSPCSPQRIVDYSYVKAGNPHQAVFPLSNGMVLQQIPEQSSILVTPVCPTVNIESFEMKIVGPELNYLTVQNLPYFALFSNEGEDVFGRNFIPGDYTLTVTGYAQDDKNGAIVYGPVVTTFKVVGALGIISMPTISSQSICAGSNIDVSFTTSGNFNQVNQFQVQLSDANGSFQNPTTIGTSNTTGTVSCFIPANIAEGTNYLIRVASSNQIAVGNPTMSAVTVNPVTSNILQNISTGTVTNKATQTLSASNKIIAPANVSYQAGNAISLNAGFEANSGSVFKAEIKGCN